MPKGRVGNHSPGLGRLPSLLSKRNGDQDVLRDESHFCFLWAVLGRLEALGKDTDIRSYPPERLETLAIPREGIPGLAGCGNWDKG